jgi:hypothetical protein
MDLRWDGMAWIDLAQDRYQWRALVKTIMNLVGTFLSSCITGVFSKGLSSMKLVYTFIVFIFPTVSVV